MVLPVPFEVESLMSRMEYRDTLRVALLAEIGLRAFEVKRDIFGCCLDRHKLPGAWASYSGEVQAGEAHGGAMELARLGLLLLALDPDIVEDGIHEPHPCICGENVGAGRRSCGDPGCPASAY
jgi:hypothetical protein